MTHTSASTFILALCLLSVGSSAEDTKDIDTTSSPTEAAIAAIAANPNKPDYETSAAKAAAAYAKEAQQILGAAMALKNPEIEKAFNLAEAEHFTQKVRVSVLNEKVFKAMGTLRKEEGKLKEIERLTPNDRQGDRTGECFSSPQNNAPAILSPSRL